MTRLAVLLAISVTALTGTACGRDTGSPRREARRVPVGESVLAVHVVGSGPDTVVVLPGGPFLGASYLREVVEALGRRHTFLLVDLRHRGGSRAPGDTSLPSAATDLADLHAVRVHFRLSRMAIVAHHAGAAPGLAYALRFPSRVTRLALLAPIPPRHQYTYDLSRLDLPTELVERFWEGLAAGRDSRDPHGFCRAFWGMAFSPAPVTDARTLRRLSGPVCTSLGLPFRAAESMRNGVVASWGSSYDWRPDLAELRVRLLVVQGRGGVGRASGPDPRAAILLHSAETWAGTAPEGRLLLVPGEVLFPWVAGTGPVTSALEDFLAGRWPASATRPAVPPTPTPLSARTAR